MKKKILFLLGILMIVSVACSLTGNASPTPKVLPTTTPNLPTVPPATATAIVLPTVVVPTTATTISSPASPGSLPDYSLSAYLDDRSTPGALVLSYANAISRHEYLRAYYYWINPFDYLGTLDNFSNLFTNISSVQVVLGSVASEGAAGSLYYTIPAVLKYIKADNTYDRYAACFLIRLPQPGNYGAPPITPMNIDRGITVLLSSSTTDDGALASVCSAPDYANSGLPGSAVSFESLADLSTSNYIDNRSGAVEVVSSLINAINRKEYVRAYSYWEDPSTHPGNYDSYAAGFNDTTSITATFGTVQSDAGAGQYYYKVPVAEVVQTTGGTTQTFVGCYILHISNPGIQATTPFRPMGISSGQFTAVPNGTSTTPLLTTACN